MPDEIYVNRPSLPSLDKFVNYLEDIWESKWLTNNGKYHQEFEKALSDYLGVKHISLFTNGTLALIVGLQAMRITGEVITTPYSFVATTHALHWNGIKPVFCDIEDTTFNMNPDLIESLITPKTTALLPVHVYGIPCNVEKIEKIADTYGLRILYDAAHCFGVKFNNESITSYGDLSILSFHATKVFTTFEGGAIVTNDEKLKKKIDFLKNFGFADEITVVAPGINAKMNELQAACGLLQLENIDEQIERRKEIVTLYRDELRNLRGIKCYEDFDNVRHNYGYFPILIDENKYGKSRDAVYDEFKKQNIYLRRYFYPLISQFPTYRGLPSAKADHLPVAEKLTRQILCLPLYGALKEKEVRKITNLLKS